MKLDTETLILALRECQQHPNIAKALLQTADRLEEISADNKHLINQNEVWKIKCEKLEAVVNGDTYNIKRLSEENEKLKIELQEANDYADKLIAHKDMVCLPADLANLREANARFAFDNHMLRDKLDKLELDSWMNSHDNQLG